ncbi:MAG: hypothetical protein H0U53_10015 [Actinobacteria bacterium]|nr:hypothetical protein [Actinomycetota bacterium]
MRRLHAVISVVILLGSLALPAGAAAESVTVRDNAFDPATTKATVGQTVVWETGSTTSDSHNVREDGKIFYSGPPDSGFTFKRVFSAGTFHYFCEVHGFRGGGMDGTVKVPVKLLDAPSGSDFTVVWATSSSNTGTRYTVQYRVGSGVWKNWKTKVTVGKATFTQGSSGTRYSFRAKSLKGDAESKWSPVISTSA